MITKDKWIWMPHPAHFICSKDCKFFMSTKVGKYIVSTVGEYLPDFRVREIFAKTRGKEIKGKGDEWDYNYMKQIGFEELHLGGIFYETMVFKAVPSVKKSGGGCEVCPFQQDSGNDLDSEYYKTSPEAFKGHYKMCLKWAKK